MPGPVVPAIGILVITILVAAGAAVGQPAAAATVDTPPTPPADTVRVAMTELLPFVEDRDGRPVGFYAEIWQVVASELDVDTEVVWIDEFGRLLPSLDEDRADVVVAPLTPTAEREARYDFSSSVVASGPQLGFHQRSRQAGGLFSALTSPPVRRILLAAVAGLLVLAHLIWLVERNRDEEEGTDFAPTYVRGIWDGFWWATVTVTTVGYGDKSPKSVGGRAVALLAMLLSLFLVGAFVSQVTEILQASRSAPPVSGLDDVGDRPVGVVEASSFARYVEVRGITTRSYTSQAAVFEAAEAGEVDLVVANPFALATIGPDHGIEPLGGVFYTEFETFGLAQGSPWREPINQVLAELHASGEIDEIVDRWVDLDGESP